MKRAFAIFLFIVTTAVAMANDIIIVGQVLSKSDADPIIGAKVWFKNTNIGTETTDEGIFLLRSETPQKKICIEANGYRDQTIALEWGKDQMLQIIMEESVTMLDEVIVVADVDRAFDILNKAREQGKKHQQGTLSAVIDENRDLDLINIKSKWMQRKLFKGLDEQKLRVQDSTYILPVYSSRHRGVMQDGALVNQDALSTSVDLFTDAQWGEFYASYCPNVNLYKTYVNIMGTNCLTPTARFASLYYYALIQDSIVNENGKLYTIHVWPKTDALPLFKGDIQVDSLTTTIVSYDLTIPHTHSFAAVNDLHAIKEQTWVLGGAMPHKEQLNIGVGLALPLANSKDAFGAVLRHGVDYKNVTFTPTLQDTTALEALGQDSDFMLTYQIAQDIEQNKFIKNVKYGLDLVLNQYLHVWKIDVGPLLNLFHYNRLEGASPRLTLRSGERFSKTLTFGGFYGYGFDDMDHKYGGFIRWRFGKNYRNELAFSYEKKVMRYGYDDVNVYNPNRVQEIENLFSSLDMFSENRVQDVALRRQIAVEYKHRHIIDKTDMTFSFKVLGDRVKSNYFNPLIHNGMLLAYVSRICLQGNFRLSWEESSIDYYFHRYYLGSRFPVVNITFDAGYYEVTDQARLYGRFGIYAHQKVPLGLGKISWAAQANFTVGALPFPWLTIARGAKVANYNSTDMMLISPMEFISDTYGAITARYQTRGYIFGYIPKIKKLGIREDIIFNIAYGGLVNKESKHLLQFPAMTQTWGKMPYMECGVGLSNIMKVLDVEFLFRLTYRNNPDAQKFGVRWQLTLPH